MDADRFETLLRSLSTLPSRRRVLRLLAGSALGGLYALDAWAGEAKKKRAKKKRKKKRRTPPLLPPCASCTGDEVCTGGACIVPACGASGPCRVFLSSMTYTGNLGGLSAADAKCQDLADAAGLPGTYKAWLSDGTSSPISRFVPSTGPYRLVNGTMIAANWTDLTDGTLLAPISVTETGGGIGGSGATWTYTESDGAPGGALVTHCSNWSTDGTAVYGDVGLPRNSDATWTRAGSAPCSSFLHLYCFQQR